MDEKTKQKIVNDPAYGKLYRHLEGIVDKRNFERKKRTGSQRRTDTDGKVKQ